MKRLFVLLLVMAGLTACDEGSGGHLKAGDPAPAFTVRYLDGSTKAFPEDFRGRGVAVRFWADWCPYCREEMKAIQPVYQTLEGKGLDVLAVNVGQDREAAAEFVDTLGGITYGVALDEDSDVAGKFRVIGLPTTFFVDRAGVVQGKILGEAEVETFKSMVERIL